MVFIMILNNKFSKQNLIMYSFRNSVLERTLGLRCQLLYDEQDMFDLKKF